MGFQSGKILFLSSLKRFFTAVFLACIAPINSAHAAGGALPPLIYDIGICLFAATLVGVVAIRCRLPSIAAFLIAGILVGPIGFQLITNPKNIETISEFGFILLLFIIGLEIDIRKIASSGKMIVISGILQYPLTVLLGMLVVNGAILVGLEHLFTGQYDALYFGIFLAGSSTLLVIKLFQERYELGTGSGRLALGILVFQDIWAIVVLVLQPTFHSPKLVPALVSFIGMFVLVGISYVLARFVVARAFQWLAKDPQMVFVGAIGWCFTIVFIGGQLDAAVELLFEMPTSLAVGSGMSSLIAGMTIATLPYAHDISAKVGIVRDFFIVLFFVGLGMGIPEIKDFDVLILAAMIVVFALLSRQLIFMTLFYVTGGDRRLAQISAVRLAQVSEFALVIAYLGGQAGHISETFSSAVIFAFVVTALLTPLLFEHAYRVYAIFAPVMDWLGFKEPSDDEEDESHSADIVLLGFHRVASSLLHEIHAHRPELMKRIMVIDFNVQIHPAIRKMGAAVRYGDLASEQTLRHAGLDSANVIIATVPDEILKGTTNRTLVKMLRQINREAIIISNAEAPLAAKELYDLGADYVYMSRVDTAHALDALIARALEGSLHEYREEQEHSHGKVHERNEVLH
ncbi:cation:proton antiporter domain-containing protein [Sneathiella glossodoripedis]|uniref:cation:proton antiporter domain-containing protein n=1 Tax=Sneathiella glossodoripedis TaxID=418853 RepID=UPI00047098B3|nr:cation:proton antiporter [Sneathiella glossodoripedis]